MRITSPILYGITDSAVMAGQQLFDKVEAALRGGAKWIQYRDKSSHANQRVTEAKQLLEICNDYGCLLIINDDIELAARIRAHGVHLGQEDTPIKQAREYLGENFIIGATCHNSLDLALSAQQQGANYLAFGCFFPSKTKSQAQPAELDILRTVRQQSPLPLVAIGGIDPDNACRVLESGADAIAVCRALFDCDDVESRAQQFLLNR